jgi:hypothetical protein
MLKYWQNKIALNTFQSQYNLVLAVILHVHVIFRSKVLLGWLYDVIRVTLTNRLSIGSEWQKMFIFYLPQPSRNDMVELPIYITSYSNPVSLDQTIRCA